MPGRFAWSQQPEHFPAKWNPVSRKKMLLTNNFARILFAKPVSTFAEIRAKC